MQVEDPKPTGDEQADFDEMLRRFKRGVAENVEAEDYEAHYDLGVAYKEMGLVDEAIAQFQKSLRGAITPSAVIRGTRPVLRGAGAVSDRRRVAAARDGSSGYR